MRFTIRRKMFLGLMVVIIVFVAVVNIIMHYLLADIAHREIVHSLENSVLAYHRFDEQRRELLLTQANSMAQTAYLKATLTIPDVDRETIYYAGVELKNIANPALMLIISDNGELLSDLNNQSSFQKSLISRTGIEQALNGSNYYGFWEYDRHFYQVAISPSFVGEQVVGLVAIGQRLDSSEVIQLAEEVTGTQVLLWLDEKNYSVDSEIQQSGKSFTDLRALSSAAQTGTIVGEIEDVILAKVIVAGRPYFTATITHQDIPGAMIFYRSIDLIASSVDPIRIIILISSALTIVFGMILSSRISSRISRPLVRLTQAAKEYGKGNFKLRIKPGSRDEVGALTKAFNQMADDIIVNRQNLLASKEAAEAASRAKSTFLATMSHEIRTPLNGVLGMAEILSNTTLDAKQAHFVDVINRSGRGLLDIINDILDFSKIEEGKLELNSSDFDLRQFIENTSHLYAANAQNKGLEFICNIPPDVSLLVKGDVVRLRQILANFIGNAIKFTENGFIEVAVKVLAKNDAKARLRFQVTDTGIGITKDNLDKIFESFTQADGSTTRIFGGTGLGLAISKQLVELMGGTIEVKSVVGKGTRFYFDLDLAAMQLPEPDNTKPVQPLEGTKVLVVDDMPTNREILHHQLSNWGSECHQVASGKECLEALHQAESEKNPYDIAILDYHMPDMDGLRLAEAIMDVAAFNNVQLVLLSSAADIDTEEKAMKLGIRSRLSKPVRQSDLYDTLVPMVFKHFEPPYTSALLEVSTRGSQEIAHVSARILVAEDTLVNQEVVVTMLDGFGCDFVVASDGVEAVAIYKEGSFDAILMDCQMPNMDGFEAANQIRDFEKKSRKARVPIIALTANAIEGDRERCLKAGMDEYMTKPFNQQKLGEMLLKWLPTKGSVAEQILAQTTGIKFGTESNLKPITNNNTVDKAESDRQTGLESVDTLDQVQNEVILESTVLDQFRTLQKPGRVDIVKRLIEAFLAESPTQIESLLNATIQNDSEALYKAAHALKSSSTNLGAKRLSVLCQKIEKIGRNGTTQGAHSLLKLLQTVHEETTYSLAEKQAETVS